MFDLHVSVEPVTDTICQLAFGFSNFNSGTEMANGQRILALPSRRCFCTIIRVHR